MENSFVIDSIKKIEESFEIAKKSQIHQKIVDAPFENIVLTTQIDIGIIVLLINNKKTKTIDRIAISNTELAKGALKASAKPFNQIKIPEDSEENIISIAIRENRYIGTEDWYFMFTPELTHEQASRNQTSASIESSYVWPLSDTKSGALIFSYYQPIKNIGKNHFSFMQEYTSFASKYI